MAIRHQLVSQNDNIKNKLYFIVLAFFTVSMTATFSVLCIKRQYGEYRGLAKWGSLGVCKLYADCIRIHSMLSD